VTGGGGGGNPPPRLAGGHLCKKRGRGASPRVGFMEARWAVSPGGGGVAENTPRWGGPNQPTNPQKKGGRIIGGSRPAGRGRQKKVR